MTQVMLVRATSLLQRKMYFLAVSALCYYTGKTNWSLQMADKAIGHKARPLCFLTTCYHFPRRVPSARASEKNPGHNLRPYILAAGYFCHFKWTSKKKTEGACCEAEPTRGHFQWQTRWNTQILNHVQVCPHTMFVLWGRISHQSADDISRWCTVCVIIEYVWCRGVCGDIGCSSLLRVKDSHGGT